MDSRLDPLAHRLIDSDTATVFLSIKNPDLFARCYARVRNEMVTATCSSSSHQSWDGQPSRLLVRELKGHTAQVNAAFPVFVPLILNTHNARSTCLRFFRLLNCLPYTNRASKASSHVIAGTYRLIPTVFWELDNAPVEAGWVQGLVVHPDPLPAETVVPHRCMKFCKWKTQIVSLRGMRVQVTGVAFSNDGRFVATASEDRTVRITYL